MKYSEKYSVDCANLSIFLTCFSNLIRASSLNDISGYLKIIPKVNHEEWNKILSETAYASGGASESFRKFGNSYRIKSGSQFLEVNPVDSWWHSLERPGELHPNLVISSVQHAIGKTEKARDRALRTETGFFGLIGRFIRIPESIMESVNPERRVERTTAQIVGYFIQIIGAIVSGYLVTGSLMVFNLVLDLIN